MKPQNNKPMALTILFIIIAVVLSMVIFADDRMVVKVAMFASGVAVGIMFSQAMVGYKHTHG